MIDYKLADVPELGYFRTDLPHPRGELLLKTESIIPGYYKRPEVTAEIFDEDGYYRTGDVMAELGPDRLVYVDRTKDTLKLSQGEFVAVSRLETVFIGSPSSGRSMCTATANAPTCSRWWCPRPAFGPTAAKDPVRSSRCSARRSSRWPGRPSSTRTRSRVTS